MFALIIQYNSSVGHTPAGVVIVHATHEPVLVGETPLSQLLLSLYTKGISFSCYDRSAQKKRTKVVRAKDLSGFLNSEYFMLANMTIYTLPYEKGASIEIDGLPYKLKEIHG